MGFCAALSRATVGSGVWVLILGTVGCAPNQPLAQPPIAQQPELPNSPEKSSTGSRSPEIASASGPTAPARWVLVPERAIPNNQQERLWSSDKTLVVDGVRVHTLSGGAPTQSLDFLPGANIGALPLPPPLGAGFVFHADLDAETVFWRAGDWTSELTPLVRLPERADRLEVGFGRVYARLADSGETVAFDPRTGKGVTLGPLPPAPSYFDFQFWDDWFAAVHTDARGVLATFDGGTTWHATGIDAEDAALSSEPGGILVSTADSRDLLAPDGTWTPEYEGVGLDSEVVPAATRASLGRNPLELAVLHGWPVGGDRAVVANWGNLGLVDLNTGQVSELATGQYPGSLPCHAVALRGVDAGSAPATTTLGIGFVCLLSNGETGVYSLAEDISLHQYASWPNQVTLWSSSNGALVANTECPSHEAPSAPTKPDAGDYCILRGRTAPQPLHVPNATGAERVVALGDGRVVVLVPPRSGAAGSLRLTTLAGALPETATPLHFAPNTPEKLRTTAELGLWLQEGGELEPGKLGFWVATANRLVGARVALDGTVELSHRTEADLRRSHLSGARAFELSSGETAWQSLDFGQTWHEVTVPRGLTSASTRESRDVVGCSVIGCSFGNWLRVGYEPEHSSVPTEAASPEQLQLRPSAYSQWNLTCYPTGISEGAKRGSASTTFALGQERPRYGTNAGFVAAPLASSGSADVASSANRPFLGVPRPTTPSGAFAFDMGADGTHQFRSYAWGQDGDGWRTGSTWLTRVADRFSVSGLWSTAPTRSPWPNLLGAAQLFGADRANRYSSSWQLSLDPSERAGMLRITTTGTTELHFIEEGAATISVGNTSFGPVSGVVKVQKAWYFGSQEGNRFHVYRVRNGVVEDFTDFPIGDPVAPVLTRNTRATALGLLLRAPAGTWHLYPISDSGQALEPIVLSRDVLNREWPRCEDEPLGYYVLGSLPLSRFTPSDGSEVLSFEGVPEEWKAEAVTARTVVTTNSQCVDALAARLASNQPSVIASAHVPPHSGSIPLTVTDRLNDVRHGFQCK